MAKYVNVTSATTTTVIPKGSSYGPALNRILISNNSANPATGICVDYYDGTNVYYIIRDTTIPSGVSLDFDGVDFDNAAYALRVSNAGTSPNITIIVK